MTRAMIIDEGSSSGSEVSFMAGLEPLLPMAYRLAYGMLHQAEEAEDAVQEATIRAWRSRSGFRAGSELRPWFLAIVANQCRQATRSRWWSVIRLADPVPTSVARPDTESQKVVALRAGLRRLAPADRLVLVLRYYLDLSFEDVATTLHISAPAARVRAHRALRRLLPKMQITEEFEDE